MAGINLKDLDFVVNDPFTPAGINSFTFNSTKALAVAAGTASDDGVNKSQMDSADSTTETATKTDTDSKVWPTQASGIIRQNITNNITIASFPDFDLTWDGNTFNQWWFIKITAGGVGKRFDLNSFISSDTSTNHDFENEIGVLNDELYLSSTTGVPSSSGKYKDEQSNLFSGILSVRDTSPDYYFQLNFALPAQTDNFGDLLWIGWNYNTTDATNDSGAP